MKKQEFIKIIKYLKNKSYNNFSYGFYNDLLITSQFVISIDITGYNKEELKTLMDIEGFKNDLQEEIIKSLIPYNFSEYEEIKITDFYWKDKFSLLFYRVLKTENEYFVALALIFDSIFNKYDKIFVEKERWNCRKSIIINEYKNKLMMVSNLNKEI